MADYLSSDHRDNAGDGCLLAALGAEIAREDTPVRRAVTAGLQAIVAVLARAVADPAFSDEMLAATARSLGKDMATGDR